MYKETDSDGMFGSYDYWVRDCKNKNISSEIDLKIDNINDDPASKSHVLPIIGCPHWENKIPRKDRIQDYLEDI